MAGIFTVIGEKLGLRGGGGDKIQYLLAGTLVLVIVISLIAAITTFTGNGGKNMITEMHYYDIETGEEFVITPDDMAKMQKEAAEKNGGGPDGMGPIGPAGLMGPMPGMLMVNPKTGKMTGVPMTKCPKCGEWFITEEMKNADPQTMMMGMAGPQVCTHCGTDIAEYYRSQRKNKKKK